MIKITQSFRPYTLIPGMCLPIPGSALYAQVFPTVWRIFSASHELLDEGYVDAQGPLKRFAVFQDLHRGGLAVVCEQYKYYILPSGKKVDSLKGLLPFADSAEPLLSLGVHKHADLHKIRYRRDLKEILPLWLRLSALVPTDVQDAECLNKGSGKLLVTAYQKIQERKKTEIYSALSSLYLAGFSENLLPRIYDTEYQGILKEMPNKDVLEKVPFSLFSYSLAMLRDLFIMRDKEIVEILPSLPPEFPCGRLIHVHLKGIGKISLEWSKKTVRRVCLHAEETAELLLCFSSELSSCRLRQWEKKQLVSSSTVSLGESMEIKNQTTYLWDCFRK
ncbi:hypothetical protein [Chlamydia psittaci]|uniref:Uncharacterized protein n=1 Tax=Chlamydia psittaci 99DC5 TaxID=1112251 RepID=A0ABP2X441_CHLPS|nr:hypothetical protein [Chlamydia psittaci]AFS22476.1 hypothetical protein B600_0313 [Chlamydia psittaci VS225]AGE74855.1 hypothetical protein AO9_01430 [Chlamydia psittaci Mat116]EPJ16098.1 hypothetical protein CP02DC18_0713 [Chlamydia psittaci 02DC18]EPJ21053.1 hypothetical protein CP02DC21_0688 [Chlamydia psittaci 02DC21]EPJ98781.1 hypothetical protein CP02DC14_0714 [Chlamydia psittaci 02DC14]EPP32169.1 hypothetical protein CPC197_0355 [Chlamydia psittaci C1/97]